MKKKLGLIILWFSINVTVSGQFINDSGYSNLSGSLQVNGIGTTNNQVPFWMRTNNYGSIPLDGVSGSVIASIEKRYERDSLSWYDSKMDWAGGAEVRANLGNKIEGQVITAYMKLHYRIFQFQFGRTKDIMGLTDPALSSGAFAVSGNALGIPKIELSIPEYWNVPGTEDLIAIKGNFAFGYFGNVLINKSDVTVAKEVETYYHQKSLYGRIGKPSWKVNIYGGFNHQVMFGSEKEYLGPAYNLSPMEALLYVVVGKSYGNDKIPRSKIGNHIGSIDQGVTYDFTSLKMNAYHQFFYDVGGLAHLSNIKDGLWGISFENKKDYNNDGIFWQKFLLEFLYSKSQGGELRKNPTPSGDEDYYNNYIYAKGWTYNGEDLGNNFFTNKKYQRKNLPHYDKEYIGNSRIILMHLGVKWQWDNWSVTNKFSFSRNYGTYATSPIGNTTGTIRTVQPPPYFYPVNQFSGYIEASRPLKKNYNIAFILATDYGSLLYNSLGGMIKLTKTW